jgi:phage/plasmid-associated DNA primase
VPFDARFRGSDQEISRQELDARLSQPSELSGFLNKAVDAWQRIQKTGRLSRPDSIKEAWREFHAMTDPLAVWLDRYTIDDPQAVVAADVLRTAYGAACERSGRPPLSDKAFTRQLSKHRPSVDRKQRTVNGRVRHCYLGIGFASDQVDDFTTSRDSRDTPTSYYRTREEEVGTEGEERSGKGEGEEVGLPRESREVVKCNHEWELRPDKYNRPGWTEKVCKLCGKSEGYCPSETAAA